MDRESGGCPDRGLGEGTDGGEKESIEPPVSGNSRGDHIAGMQTVAEDIVPTHPLIQLTCEQDVTQLRVIVSDQRNKA